MVTTSDGIPLQKFIEHFFQEIICADAQAQVLQETGWNEFQKSVKITEGIDIAGGIGELAHLGLREVKMSFYVEPVRPGLWQRTRRITRYLLGRPIPPERQVFHLASDAKRNVAAFQITITVARAADGSFSVESSPPTEQLKSAGEVYVTDIID